MFARRIRRLERAADRIASGRFDEPVVDTRRTSSAQLARAFDRMRVRLAASRPTRAGSSSPTPRTSCARRSSRSAASSSCSTTKSSTIAHAAQFLASMREQVDRLTKLASDLLDLSRLDAGRLGRARAGRRCGALAADLAEEFGPLAASATIGSTWRPRATRSSRRRTSCGCSSSAGSGRERCCTRRRGRRSRCGRAVRRQVRVLEVEDAGPGIPRGPAGPAVRARSSALTARAPRAAASALRSRRQLAELMDGRDRGSTREPGRTVFHARSCPAAALPRARFHAKGPFRRRVATTCDGCREWSAAVAPRLRLCSAASPRSGRAVELTGWTDSSSTTTVFRAAPAATVGRRPPPPPWPDVKPTHGQRLPARAAIYATPAAAAWSRSSPSSARDLRDRRRRPRAPASSSRRRATS